MKKPYKILLFMISFFCMLYLIGCSNKTNLSKNPSSKTTLTVAVSIIPEETFVKAVCGDLVNVVTLIPSGQSPETFEPTPDILERFSESKLYFTMNVPSEVNSILPKSKDFNPDVKIVNLAKEVSAVYKEREFAPGHRDPHIWLSPKRVKIMVNSIRDNLCKLDPSNEKIYKKNAESYTKKLDSVDKDIKTSLDKLKIKSIIVYHPAFGYFADDYGLEMIALEEEGKESTPKSMQKIVDFAKAKKVKTVFFQAETDSKQAETFANELGGKCEKLAPLDPNYIDNLKKMANTFKSILK